MVEVHPLRFVHREFKFLNLFLVLLYMKWKSIDNYINSYCLNYICWINVTKSRPLQNWLSFTSIGGFYEHFCSLHMLYYLKRNMLDVAVTASGVKVSLNFCNSLFWCWSTLWDSFPEYLNYFSSFSRWNIHEVKIYR